MLAPRTTLEEDDRILGPGDAAALAAFLSTRGDSALIMESNFRSAGLQDRGEPFHGAYAARWRRGIIIGVVAHYWNGIAQLEAEDEAAALLSLACQQSGRPLTFVLGAGDVVESTCIRLGLSCHAQPSLEGQVLMTLALDKLRTPDALASGALCCRRPRSSELELVMNWRVAFRGELHGEADSPTLQSHVRDEIQRHYDKRNLWVLDYGGRLVSTCAVLARTPVRVQIGAVYTPGALRGHGFARAVVAGALLKERSKGRRRAALWTGDDAAKRTYGNLGFETIDSYGMIRLETAS